MISKEEIEQRKAELKKKRQDNLEKARAAKKGTQEPKEEVKTEPVTGQEDTELVNELNELEALEQQVKEKKEKEKKVMTTPWKRVKRLDIPESFKNHNFVYRWCNKDAKGNIQAKLEQGWEIDRELTLRLNSAGFTRAIDDGTPLDSTLSAREMIVMRLPKERKAARDEWLKSRTKGPKELQAQFEAEGKGISGGYGKITYGKIQEE